MCIGDITNASNASDAQAAMHKLVKDTSEYCDKKHGVDAMDMARRKNPLEKNKIQSVLKEAGKETTGRWNKALLSNDVSYRGMANVRRDVSLEEKDKKSHFQIKPDRFHFDRQAVKDQLVSLIDLGTNVNWTDLARKYKVLHPKGHPAKNGNEVLKAFAVEEGLVISSSKRRNRRGKRKIDIDGVEIDLTTLFPTDEALKADTRDKISSGVWDIGSPIVPITVQCKRLNSKGRIETRTLTMYGRSYTLQKIMDRTLVSHTKEGFMRKPYPPDYSISDAKQELAEKGMVLVSNARTGKFVAIVKL